MKHHRLTGTQFPYLLTDAALSALALRAFVVPKSPEGYRLTLNVGLPGAQRFTTHSLRLAEDLARGAGHQPLFIIEYGPEPEKAPSNG